MKFKNQIRRLFNKKAGASVGKAIKILTSVVLGAAMIAGTYGIVKLSVIPKTGNKISSMFEVTGDILAEAGGVIPTVDKFSDGPCSYFYYDTLQNAVADAGAHTTENANADESTGKALIAVRQSDDVYIVKPTEDQTITSSISMSNKMIFDANGKQIELAAGAEFKPTENSDITFRDSGNGKIYKDVDSANTERLIDAKSITTSTITMLNGSYEVKNKTKSAFLIRSDGVFNSEGGNFYAYTEGGNSAVFLNVASGTPVVNISGGKYESVSKNNSTKVMQLYGATNISGGEFNANSDNAMAECLTVNKGGSLNVLTGDFNCESSQRQAYCIEVGDTITGNIKINGGTFNAKSNTSSTYCVINYSTNGNIEINGGAFKTKGNALWSCCISDGSSTGENISINGGNFESSTTEGNAFAIHNVKEVKNADVKAYATNESGTNQAIVLGIYLPTDTSAEISNSNIVADYNYAGTSNDDYSCRGIYAKPNTNLAINNCHVKATREALVLYGANAYINGGTYEGVQHGGAYFSGEKAVVKDATFRKWDYDGKYNKDNFECYNASFYIGSPDREVKVFMNNCRVENATNSVLSSNYNNKNTYLYASNTAFNNIRIDGANSNGDKGHMYVGKGCTYNSTSGSGDLDTTTYSSVEFTPEYVQNNFS